MKALLTLTGWLLPLFFALLSAQTLPKKSLERELREFEKNPALKHASWGIYVFDVNSGRTIASRNENQALVPASTIKVLTTASALKMLGHDFRFETTLAYTGQVIDTGTLLGDLVIKGSGDPSFMSDLLNDSLGKYKVFAQWLADLKLAGINHISGRVFADESVFDQELIPRKWLWEDMGNYFGAGASGLTANENMYTVFFQPGDTIGQPAKVVGTNPGIPGMEFINQVTTGPPNSGDQVFIFGAPYQMIRTLTGTVPLGSSNFPVRGSIPDPPMYVASSFSEFLKQQGIRQDNQPLSARTAMKEGILPEKITGTISIWHSPALTSLAAHANMHSVNTYTENMVKIIGARLKGQGSTNAGIDTIIGFWRSYGVDVDGMFLFDGSGLAPSNRVTVKQLAQILSIMAQDANFELFQSGFPLAGRSGSIANQFIGTPSEGVLRAKSGSLTNVRGFAGYTRTYNGRLIAFVILVNHFQGRSSVLRNHMIQIMDAITRYNQ
ncbi:MAG TPA: D-alanyl-D-alanine carboxypeptidase/D-alanyl-D-alanine-endopeptidase [Bacteroidales bacterium]|nr:D-alanyl-D-alanine carboxypeptidase/D-alanyl-D-alanine-endopeptidase [Bacteroidales bacterium]